MRTFRFQPRLILLAALFSLWLVAVHLIAAVPQEFESANKLYEQGKFKEAATAYQKLIDSGTSSAALYFNLGNARFKAGEKGRAMIAYRTAAALNPGDKDIQANLTFVRTVVNGGIEPPQSQGRALLRMLSVNAWTAIATALLWWTSVLFIASQLRPTAAARFKRWIWPAAALSAVALTIAFQALEDRTGRTEGVILLPEVVVRYGPLEESQSRFTLRDGSEVTIEDRKDAWVKIRDNNERVGWIKSDSLQLLAN